MAHSPTRRTNPKPKSAPVCSSALLRLENHIDTHHNGQRSAPSLSQIFGRKTSSANIRSEFSSRIFTHKFLSTNFHPNFICKIAQIFTHILAYEGCQSSKAWRGSERSAARLHRLYATRGHRSDGNCDRRCHADGDGTEVTGREVATGERRAMTGGDGGLQTSGDCGLHTGWQAPTCSPPSYSAVMPSRYRPSPLVCSPHRHPLPLVYSPTSPPTCSLPSPPVTASLLPTVTARYRQSAAHRHRPSPLITASQCPKNGFTI